ncbi:MAG: hypothetical protein KDJ69_03940 [Nitratireductor sp.]|nr:hypothetical protein [Nitratireductor sp.]
MFRCFLVSTLLLAAGSAMAEEIDWPQQIAGLDGVTVGCSNANKEKYAAKICSDMTGHIMAELGKANITAADLGAWYSHDEEEPAKPGTMVTPLKVTVFVRGTNSGGTHAINLRSRLSVDYEKAVEAGSESPARKGELVLWEGSTTGSGPRDALAKAITKAAMEKLDAELKQVIEAWPTVQ